MSDVAAFLDMMQQIVFGPFRLIPAQQVLLEGERPVRLGSRAREILLALLERPGEVISKEELIARVWPNSVVEEGNLKVHVAALRKAIGDGHSGRRYITNVPGRGYSFVGTISSSGSLPASTAAVSAPSNGPPVVRGTRNRIVGRAEVVTNLVAQLTLHRFVTLVGPGGVGKTTVARAAADDLATTLDDGVYFVDLSPLSDQKLVPSALASVLGIAVRSENPIAGLLSFLCAKNCLVIIDNCEHVIDAAAVLAEELAKGAQSVMVLATSREPLRVEGERVHRLPPLQTPAETLAPTAAEALEYPAIQLFVERAAASFEGFTLKDSDAPIVAETCRRLDGLALAIELAASRIDAFGVSGLASLLTDGLDLGGRRTAMPRHRTLGAMLDWSYVLLSDPERVVLCRLAVFAGTFPMDAAITVAGGDGLSASKIVECVANLVAKSLVSAAVYGDAAQYRLLDTTRAYARNKTFEEGNTDRFAHRHAIYCLERLRSAEADWESRPAEQWIARYKSMIDDVRVALDWSFCETGDTGVGVALTVAALPLWFQLSLINECNGRVETALLHANSLGNDAYGMRLYAALAWSLMQTRGSVPETRVAWTHVLRLAQSLGNGDYQLRALWGLWAGTLNRCELRPALALANRFYELAATLEDPADRLVGDRMIGYIRHLLGDQSGARDHMERMLAGYSTPVIGAQMIRFVFDQRATARCFLARILWLQGFPDRAMRMVEDIVHETMSGKDTLSICQALVQAACPVAIFAGDRAKLELYVDMLIEHSGRNSLGFFSTWGRCFKGVLLTQSADVDHGIAFLSDALVELRKIQYGVYYATFLGTLTESLARVGDFARARNAIDEALDRSFLNEEFWFVAELLRIKGEVLYKQNPGLYFDEAEATLLKSLDWARRQQTLAWELRSSISLVSLERACGRAEDGTARVKDVVARFTEGFETRDLIAARAYLSK